LPDLPCAREPLLLLIMNDAQYRLLTLLGQPQARLTADETACALGFQPHDLAVLMAVGLLKPLGKPAQNAPKFFAAKTVQELGRDEQWLHKATLAVARHWHGKNARRKPVTELGGSDGPATA
jgi:hypothetical protein